MSKPKVDWGLDDPHEGRNTHDIDGSFHIIRIIRNGCASDSLRSLLCAKG